MLNINHSELLHSLVQLNNIEVILVEFVSFVAILEDDDALLNTEPKRKSVLYSYVYSLYSYATLNLAGCRKCAAIPVYHSTNLETIENRQHSLR